MGASYVKTTTVLSRLEIGQCLKLADVFTAPGAATYSAGLILARSTVSQKLVPYAVGGASGTGTPCAILEADVVSTGAGDYPVTPIMQGEVYKDKISILAGGTITAVNLDVLRSFGIIAVSSEDVSEV